MKLTIEPTNDFVKIEGAPCRVWTGEDQTGTPVQVFVRTLSPQTHDADRLKAFDEELHALPSLEAVPAPIELRFVVD